MKHILLDTNFFLVPFQLGVNIMSEFDRIIEEPYQMITIKPVKEELERLARNGKGGERSAARLGIHLARNIEVVEAEGKADDVIVSYAKNHKDVMVATNDSTLRKRLKSLKVPTIFVRNRSKLEIG